VYRIFYYDATPYEGKSHHPLMNRSVDFAKSDLAAWRTELFEQLRSQRKFALRLGKVARDGDWSLPPNRVKKLLKTRDWITGLDFDDPSSALTDTQREEGKRIQAAWAVVQDTDVSLNLKQKGVDMRIGLDIASIALKRQADTIVLIAGDSDFVPAAKFARREGMEFILDPLWQKVNSDLFEHIDGLQSGLKKPTGTEGVAPVTGSSNNPDEPE